MLDEALKKTVSSGSEMVGAVGQTEEQIKKSLENLATALGNYKDGTSVAVEGSENLSESQKEVIESTMTWGERLEETGKKLQEIGGAAREMISAISDVTGGLEFWDSFEGFGEAEKAERGLNQMIKSNGREVEGLIVRYKEFADTIQSTTSVEGDSVISLLKQAEAYDVTGASAERAVKNALALSEVHGINAQSVIKLTSALEQGSAQALGRYFPSLRKIKDETERVAEAQRLLANMQGVLSDSASTSTGKMEQLKNMYGDFKEAIGELISVALEPMIATMQSVVEEISKMPKWMKITIAVMLGLLTVVAAVGTAVGGLILAATSLAGALGITSAAATATVVALTALKVVAVIGVAYAFYELGAALSGAAEEYENFNQATKQSTELNDKWSAKFSANTESIMKSLADLKGEEKKTAIDEQLKTAQKEMRGYENMVKSSTKEVEELDGRWSRWTGNKMLELAKSNLEEHNKKLGLAKERVDKLSQSYEKVKSPQENPEILKAIEKFNKELETQKNTFGMTADQVKLYNIELLGATRQQLEATRTAIEYKNALLELGKLASTAEALMRSMNKHKFDIRLDVFGLTDFEKKLKELDIEVAEMQRRLKLDIPFNDKDLKRAENDLKIIQDHIKALNEGSPTALRFTKAEAESEVARLNKEIDKMRKLLTDNQELLRQIEKAETFRVIAHNQMVFVKALERSNDMLKQGMDITTQYLTPFEQYSETVNKISSLVSAGAISQETFNRAMEDANKKLDDVEKSARKARQEIQKLIAIDFKSAEAKFRMDEFKQTIKDQVNEFKKLQRIRSGRNVLPPMRTDEEHDIEERARENVRRFRQQQDEIDKRKTPRTIPDVPTFPNMPQSINIPEFNTPEINAQQISVSSVADSRVDKDRQEELEVLKSINTILNDIKKKPGATLEVANITT